jgi:ribonuclease P protein component
MSDEAHFSAEQSGSGTSARLPSAVVHGSGPQHIARTSGTRSQKALRLITIKKRRDFLAANSAKRAAMQGFILQVRARGDESPATRVGFTVTKKVGNAVIRNRMKRRLRALAREVIAEHGAAGADHILIGRAGQVEREFALMKTELIKALAKVRV